MTNNKVWLISHITHAFKGFQLIYYVWVKIGKIIIIIIIIGLKHIS